MSKQKRKIPGDKRYSQPFSYLKIVETSKAQNPHPQRFPDFLIRDNTLYGWFSVKAKREAVGWLPAYKVGSWVYEMVPLRGV